MTHIYASPSPNHFMITVITLQTVHPDKLLHPVSFQTVWHQEGPQSIWTAWCKIIPGQSFISEFTQTKEINIYFHATMKCSRFHFIKVIHKHSLFISIQCFYLLSCSSGWMRKRDAWSIIVVSHQSRTGIGVGSILPSPNTSLSTFVNIPQVYFPASY